jgi:hypothetical protein
MRNLNSNADKNKGPYRLFVTDSLNGYGIAKKIEGKSIKSVSSRDDQQINTSIVKKAQLIKF